MWQIFKEFVRDKLRGRAINVLGIVDLLGSAYRLPDGGRKTSWMRKH
jgi:hypothetical protein